LACGEIHSDDDGGNGFEVKGAIVVDAVFDPIVLVYEDDKGTKKDGGCGAEEKDKGGERRIRLEHLLSSSSSLIISPYESSSSCDIMTGRVSSFCCCCFRL